MKGKDTKNFFCHGLIYLPLPHAANRGRHGVERLRETEGGIVAVIADGKEEGTQIRRQQKFWVSSYLFPFFPDAPRYVSDCWFFFNKYFGLFRSVKFSHVNLQILLGWLAMQFWSLRVGL